MRRATSVDPGAGSVGTFPPFFSLYIHVPFCRNLCSYCHFYRVPPRSGHEAEFLSALSREASALGPRAPGPVRTLYVGGGTPSLLSAHFYSGLFSVLKEVFAMEELVEATVEVDARVTRAELSSLADCGFDRVSIGVKSFQEGSLKKLGAGHDSANSLFLVHWAREAGFSSVGIDLIYGFEAQGMDDLVMDLRTGLAVMPDHISLYALEECPEGGAREGDPDETADMFREAGRVLSAGGFCQYEICNFAKPGHHSRHNLNYWMDGDYFGLGPSAHSASSSGGCRRRWANRADLEAYLLDPVSVGEEMSSENSARSPAEALMLALRCTAGVNVDAFFRRYGVDPRKLMGPSLDQFVETGLIRCSSRRVRLTTRGMLLSNEIFERFI